MLKKLFVLLICLAVSATTLAGITTDDCGGGCCASPVEATLTSGDGHSCCCCANTGVDVTPTCAPAGFDGDFNDIAVDNQRVDISKFQTGTTVALLAIAPQEKQFERIPRVSDPPSPSELLALLQRLDC